MVHERGAWGRSELGRFSKSVELRVGFQFRSSTCSIAIASHIHTLRNRRGLHPSIANLRWP